MRRRLLRLLAWGCLCGGLLVAAMPYVQGGYAAWAQRQLEKAYLTSRTHASPAGFPRLGDAQQAGAGGLQRYEFLDQVFGAVTGLVGRILENPVLAHPDRERTGQAAAGALPGDAYALLTIPRAGVRAVVLPGTDPLSLAQGPGFYPEGALPGDGGNTAIAGHRTTYGAWFRHLDRLRPGDLLELTFRGERFVYAVQRVWAVAPDDWSVIAPAEQETLTLTTCHPPGSSRERLVVRARLLRREAPPASTADRQPAVDGQWLRSASR